MAQDSTGCMAKLVGLADPVKDKEYPLQGIFKIGRDQKTTSCTITHASVSRQHAQLLSEAGAWLVEDLRSTNGVFVNDAKISQKTRLKDGDVVRIGDVPLRFTLVQPQTQIGKAPAEEEDGMTIPSGARASAAAAAVANASATPAPVAAPAPAPAPAPVADAKPAPTPLPPAPKPAPAVRAAPAPAPAASSGGGEDLFEPSIIGNVGQALAAAQQQQQQEQKSAAAKSTSREPEDFEGTMYGPGVARQLVKAIREEKPEAAHEQKPAAGIVARAIGGGGGGVALPNMFWLKIKAAVFFIVFLGIVAGLVLWGYTASQADKAVKAKYNELNLEYTDFNARTGNLSPESLEKTLAPDLATLTKLLESAKTAQKDFPNSKVFTPRLDDLVAKVGFRVFERQLQQAIVKGDVKAVDAAVDQFMAVAPEDQKKLDKLARLVGRFQVFKRHYPDRPEISAKVPPSTLVKELVDSIDDLKKAVRDQKGLIPMDAKLFSRTATEAAEAEGLCGNWGTFWADYEKAKGTPAQLESFKKGYPHIKDWDAIK